MRERMVCAGCWSIDGYQVRKRGSYWRAFTFLSGQPVFTAKTLHEVRKWIIDRSGECS